MEMFYKVGHGYEGADLVDEMRRCRYAAATDAEGKFRESLWRDGWKPSREEALDAYAKRLAFSVEAKLSELRDLHA